MINWPVIIKGEDKVDCLPRHGQQAGHEVLAAQRHDGGNIYTDVDLVMQQLGWPVIIKCEDEIHSLPRHGKEARHEVQAKHTLEIALIVYKNHDKYHFCVFLNKLLKT